MSFKSRTCSSCKKPSRAGDAVCFSNNDGRYLHGNCRVAERGYGGEPFSHPKFGVKNAANVKLKQSAEVALAEFNKNMQRFEPQ